MTTAPPDPAGSPRPGRGISVRELRWTDFNDLRETYFLLYEERAAGEPIGITLFHDRPALADEARWFAGLFDRALSGSTLVSIAEVDGHAVGSCTVGRVGPSDDAEMGHVGELGILVHRDYRGRGVGSALLEDTLRRCRGRFELVRLAVFSVNEGARRLYERFGFVPYGHLPKAIRRGDAFLDEDLMYLDLGRTGANR